MTGELVTLPSSDKEYLELLLFKIAEMKRHGQAWFGQRMPADEKLYNAARKSLNEYVNFLRKKGYNYDRYKNLTPKQNELFG